MHGDLKLGNILIKKENNKNIYKLTDYGVSKEFLKINEELMAWGGAPQYSAPEYLKDAEFDLSSDLWSLGIILYTLFKGKEPYEGNIPSEVLNDIDSKGQNNLNQISNDPQFDNLIRRLLTVNPKDRITWDSNILFLKKEIVGNIMKKNNYQVKVNILRFIKLKIEEMENIEL